MFLFKLINWQQNADARKKSHTKAQHIYINMRCIVMGRNVVPNIHQTIQHKGQANILALQSILSIAEYSSIHNLQSTVIWWPVLGYYSVPLTLHHLFCNKDGGLVSYSAHIFFDNRRDWKPCGQSTFKITHIHARGSLINQKWYCWPNKEWIILPILNFLVEETLQTNDPYLGVVTFTGPQFSL